MCKVVLKKSALKQKWFYNESHFHSGKVELTFLMGKGIFTHRNPGKNKWYS